MPVENRGLFGPPFLTVPCTLNMSMRVRCRVAPSVGYIGTSFLLDRLTDCALSIIEGTKSIAARREKNAPGEQAGFWGERPASRHAFPRIALGWRGKGGGKVRMRTDPLDGVRLVVFLFPSIVDDVEHDVFKSYRLLYSFFSLNRLGPCCRACGIAFQGTQRSRLTRQD